MNWIVQILISALAVYLTALILPGVSVRSFFSSVLVAIVLALLNTFLKPLLQLVSLPATILTLGLFLFVINTIIILLASSIMGDRFHVNGFGWALLFSIVVSLVSGLLGRFFD